MCDPCLFPTMPPNKALQMDPDASRLVVPVTKPLNCTVKYYHEFNTKIIDIIFNANK